MILLVNVEVPHPLVHGEKSPKMFKAGLKTLYLDEFCLMKHDL